MSTTHAYDGKVLVVGFGRSAEIQKFSPRGELRAIVRWPQEPDPVTRTDRRHYSDARLDWLARMPIDPETRFFVPSLDEFPEVPSERPIFDKILIDGDGGVWLRNFPAGSFGVFDVRLLNPPPPHQIWTVLDSAGIWLGSLEMPAQFDLRVIANRKVYGVVKDSLDVETVQIFQILN